MSNLKTYVEVHFGGKQRLLKYDVNSACDLEDHFGKGVPAILNEEQIGFRLCRGFYWAGLKWKEHGLTIQRVGLMLNKEIQEEGKTIMDMMEPVMDALKKSRLLNAPKDEFDEQDAVGNEEEPDEDSEVTPN
ncbi:hypothetical protein [Bacillus sp. 1NLA3E]|uniref:hypothetical protein n=1 Tax=Bacillus sp. 1NLA3E TaxID=666686 RepID=UPI000247E64B|nr:hypothetical protein [Bacillus sp. 1NLA3E]AGK52034.1 hypothetical protein B1NLA3E_01250 [Bacillus sp. 1NLA3E]